MPLWLCAAGLGSSSSAYAAQTRVIRPATRPWFHTLAFGPSISFADCKKGTCGAKTALPGASFGGFTQAMIRNEIGYHLNRKGFGPALSGEIDFAFPRGSFRFIRGGGATFGG